MHFEGLLFLLGFVTTGKVLGFFNVLFTHSFLQCGLTSADNPEDCLIITSETVILCITYY